MVASLVELIEFKFYQKTKFNTLILGSYIFLHVLGNSKCIEEKFLLVCVFIFSKKIKDLFEIRLFCIEYALGKCYY